MPLGTLDRDPPPFFRQGPSALSKLAVFSALAIFLMVADVRFKVMQPLRVVLASVLYPVQWLALQPVQLAQGGSDYLSTLHSAQLARDDAIRKLGLQAQRANQVDQLTLENERLRKLLGLRERLHSRATAAQVLYDAADPYTRKVIIDKGIADQVGLGSPVLDEHGVLGQVTRVYPLVSEVTLISDRDHATPVLNARTSARGVVFGDVSTHADAMELRFMAANADVAEGDLLTTSGVDGVYPPGLPVARIEKIERRADAAFARIYCVPLALVGGASHVMVLEPPASQIPRAAFYRSGNPTTEAGGPAMIMRPGQQLLLPANPLFIWLSLLTALLLNMLQNMGLWGRAAWMPDLLAVVLVFWTVHQPLRVSIGAAFLFGLLMDVHQGALLGQHAMAYTVLSFFAITIHRRLLWFTVPSQAAQVLPLFLVAHLVELVLRMLAGGKFPGFSMVVAPFLEAALWPVASVVLLAPQRRAPDPDANRPL